MSRKRLTQRYPFLLPIRKKQRQLLFYMKMGLDQNTYAKTIGDQPLAYKIFETESLMVNKNSGFDMKYQMNKVHNLKIAAKTLDRLLIKPKETFSFYQLVRYADKNTPYKEGLNLSDGKITGSYGGGLCQLSNLLFWMFLHTPLIVVERHGHAVQFLPPTSEGLPYGTDATISEGWLDLKVRNDTEATYQIVLSFDADFIHGQILSSHERTYGYEIFNKSVTYFEENGKVMQKASVDCNRLNRITLEMKAIHLYNNVCQIGYTLPEPIEITEKREQEYA